MALLPKSPTARLTRLRFVAYLFGLIAFAATYWWLNRPEPIPGAEYIFAPAENLTWFRDAKFGIMIHWGPGSLTGKELSWSRGGIRPGFEGAGPGPVPVEVYDRLYQDFNPIHFDPDAWMNLFRRAGARYIVFVTKHHDGFCMFDSRLTEKKITRAPYGRDITAEISGACRKAGLKLGFYYSQPDWPHPDYRKPTHSRYIPYLHGHLHELCIGYGNVDIFWFDGLNWREEDWDAANLFRMIRRLQPKAIINNRCALKGDFSIREEMFGEAEAERAWEMCWKIGSQWSYKPDDNTKTLPELLGGLLRAVGSGGNLLLNVGPTPDGMIEPVQAERLEQIGAWLARYGESVYGTRAGPFRPDGWGAATHRDNTIYLHVLRKGSVCLNLPAIGRRVQRAELMTGGTAEALRTADGLRIVLKPDTQAPPWTVKLELDGPSPGLFPDPDLE